MENYSTYPDTTVATSTGSELAFAAFISMLGFFFLFFIVTYVIVAIFLGKIFKKAGIPSWIGWVPIYNTWKMFEIGGQKGALSLLLFIPFVNVIGIVFMYIAMFNIGRKLGKEDWFILLAIFLPIVWYIWLGADHSAWDEGKGAPRADTSTLPVTDPATPSSAAPGAMTSSPSFPQQSSPTAPTMPPTAGPAPQNPYPSTSPQNTPEQNNNQPPANPPTFQ